jgi:hypothetical protein
MIFSTAPSGLSTYIDMSPLLQPWGRASAPSVVSTSAPPVPDIVARIAGSLEIGSTILGPVPIPADWLSTVSRRIKDSVIPDGREFENEGQWLTSEMAVAATDFFRLTSDVLPGEPHIYSARSGSLVAEFNGNHGVMNAVISAKSFVALVVVDGNPIEKRIDSWPARVATLREELEAITTMLRDGEHGQKTMAA